MKKALSICFFISVTINIFGLSDKAKVSIITCGSGPEIHTNFGHSAIRITDPTISMDMMYNYGTFKFSTPNFILKFLKGNLEYRLKKEAFQPFKNSYLKDDRSMYEQELNLNKNQINQLYKALEENAKSKNMYYIYDFYNKNCSTKILDQLEALLKDQLVYQSSLKHSATFRESVNQVSSTKPWLGFGLDLIQGRKVDRQPNSLLEKTNLPITLFEGLKSCYIKTDAKTSIPFVTKYHTINDGNTIDKPLLITPKLFFWGLFLISIYITFFNAISLARLFDWLLFFSVGLVGLLTTTLWAFSSHIGFSFHVNALWINPLHIIISFYILLAPGHKLIKKYFLNYNIIFIGMLAYLFFNPIEFNSNILPLLLTVLFRSFSRSGKGVFGFGLFKSI